MNYEDYDTETTRKIIATVLEPRCKRERNRELTNKERACAFLSIATMLARNEDAAKYAEEMKLA